jgi:uncharacterized protein YjiS (DUF1127 family)
MPRSHIETLPIHTRPGLTGRLALAIREALARRRDRQFLSRLDEHLLRDIGLSADEARTECAKPFWQP